MNTLVRLINGLDQPNPRILDVGCGTGNHATILAEAGFDVTAIDLSPHMISVANDKTSHVKFKWGDVAGLEETDFQFCYSLYNVINCLDSMETLIRFFTAILVRLTDGGMLLIEAWNPMALIAQLPEVVERTFEYEDETIVRKAVPFTDLLNQRLDLRYDIDVHSTKGPLAGTVKSFHVTHHLRLFTPFEIQYCLKQAGFSEIGLYTALPEMSHAIARDRMLAFTTKR